MAENKMKLTLFMFIHCDNERDDLPQTAPLFLK